MKIGTFDVEANGLVPDATTVWCASVIVHDAKGNIKEEEVFEPEDIPELTDHLDTFDILIGHNCIDYDFALLKKLFNWEFKGKIVDTLIMSRVQRPKRRAPKGSTGGPHSVESWAIRFGRQKQEHEEWDRYSPEMLERCRSDAHLQVEIYRALMEEGQGEGWGEAHRLNMKLFSYLKRQETYGWTIDQRQMDFSLYMLDRWMEKIKKVVEPYLPAVYEVVGGNGRNEDNYLKAPFLKSGDYSKPVKEWFDENEIRCVGGPFTRVKFRLVDLDKRDEVKAFLLGLGWEPAEWNYNNAGQPTSPKLNKDDPFDGIDNTLGTLITRYVQCRQRRGTIEGWKEAIREDGRVPTSTNGLAATGRVRHKLIVNIPSKENKTFFGEWMRSMFIPREGWVMVGVDSKGNQARQLAARMGNEEFKQAELTGSKEDGSDWHSKTQKRIGVATRTLAKNFFYARIFGAQVPKIAKTISVSIARAKELLEKYDQLLPDLPILIERLTNQWRQSAHRYWNPSWNKFEYKNGYIRGLDGRPIIVEQEHKVLNYQLQSDEAIQMGAAYVMFNHWMDKHYTFGEDWGMLIWYHDEFQFEGRTMEIAKHGGELASRAIEWAGEYFNIDCPHEGEVKIGNSWSETH